VAGSVASCSAIHYRRLCKRFYNFAFDYYCYRTRPGSLSLSSYSSHSLLLSCSISRKVDPASRVKSEPVVAHLDVVRSVADNKDLADALHVDGAHALQGARVARVKAALGGMSQI
jgi:hypothetical protein